MKTQERILVPGGHLITTRYLSPDVPGHLVEEIKEFYADLEKQPEGVLKSLWHEVTADVTIPKAPTP